MSKVTSKLQVTIPKTLADRLRIQPGDEVRWEILGRGALMVAETATRPRLSPIERLALFRDRVRRQMRRQKRRKPERGGSGGEGGAAKGRGWTRDDLYEDDRGLRR